jgi:hypothetical protein
LYIHNIMSSHQSWGTKVCEWPKYGSTGVLQIDGMSQTYFFLWM